MESLASGSGATLGYIVGNLPGAYWGYKIGKMVYRKRKYFILPAMRKRAKGAPTGRYMKKRPIRRNNNVTQQRDFATQYRKSYMPKYKKRSWKNFTKKVTAVQIKNAGLKTVLRNFRIVSTSAANKQQIAACLMYGNQGTTDEASALAGCRDLYRIFQNDPDITRNLADPNNPIPISGKLTFASAVLDLTIRNLAEIDCEVDVYHVVYQKDQDLKATGIDNPVYPFSQGEPLIINTGNTAVNINERGTTLFDISSALSATRTKILKKVKYYMEPGRSLFIQHRDPKNYVIDVQRIKNTGFGLQGVTFGIIVVHKPTVSNAENLVSTLAIGCTRKYSYTALEENTDCATYNL